jgi:hypothetical protein
MLPESATMDTHRFRNRRLNLVIRSRSPATRRDDLEPGTTSNSAPHEIVLGSTVDKRTRSRARGNRPGAPAPFTPLSTWTTGTDRTGFDAARHALGAGPGVLRDYTKSMKHYWHEATYIPDTPDQLPPADADVPGLAAAVAGLALPFVTVDLARRTDGTWRVIELGDGQRPATEIWHGKQLLIMNEHRTSPEIGGRATSKAASFPGAVTLLEEVRPVNVVSMWVLPSSRAGC